MGKRLCFDIDGTLCSDTGGNYEQAEPYTEAISKVNNLFYQGHVIILYTARGSRSGKDYRVLTKRQLKEWGVKYHELVFGKPDADIFVDDNPFYSPSAFFYGINEGKEGG